VTWLSAQGLLASYALTELNIRWHILMLITMLNGKIIIIGVACIPN